MGNNNNDNNVYNLYIDPIAYDNRLTFLTTFPSISMYELTTTPFTMCAFVTKKKKTSLVRTICSFTIIAVAAVAYGIYLYSYSTGHIVVGDPIERVNNK